MNFSSYIKRAAGVELNELTRALTYRKSLTIGARFFALELLKESEASISEVCERLGIGKTTGYRQLKELIADGVLFVSWDKDITFKPVAEWKQGRERSQKSAQSKEARQ